MNTQEYIKLKQFPMVRVLSCKNSETKEVRDMVGGEFETYYTRPDMVLIIEPQTNQMVGFRHKDIQVLTPAIWKKGTPEERTIGIGDLINEREVFDWTIEDGVVYLVCGTPENTHCCSEDDIGRYDNFTPLHPTPKSELKKFTDDELKAEIIARDLLEIG